jgi:flagellar biosynthesis protein FlhG
VGRIVAVGGGKGGVGKSLVSTNLAVTLAQSGARVVMLDADLGAPNLHTMFGIMRPPRTVEDFLAGRSASLREVALATPVPGLRLICGAEGALGSGRITPEAKQRLLAELARLDADCLIIDVGAGVNIDTIDFFNAADTRLVVMVPEITSLQNGYAFLKIALFRRFQLAVAGMGASQKLAGAFGDEAFEIGSTMDRVSTFFAMLEDEVPELVASFRLLLQEFNARIVGNMLHTPADRNALFAMQRMIRDRLGLEVDVVAGVSQNAQVRSSVNTGRPYATVAPHTDPDLRELRKLAETVLQQDLSTVRRLRAEFVRALRKRPQVDPNLDARFDFGFEGMATAHRPGPKTPPPIPLRARPAAAAFATEIGQVQRASERISVSMPVEINFDGRWYLGRVTEINEGGAHITGIRAPSTWDGARGTLRRAGDDRGTSALAISLHSVNAATASVVIRFVDAAAAGRLVATLRQDAPRLTG